MSKKVKLSILVLIIALVGGLVSIRKSVRNITLVGMVHNTKTMDAILSICDSRTLSEADQACAESVNNTYTEISNLCKLRLNSDAEQFNNKCLRFYRYVERAKTSQSHVADFLKTARYNYLILENVNSISGSKLDPKKTGHLIKSEAMIAFTQKYPNYEDDIVVCRDYQIEKSCKIMKDFFSTYTEAIRSYLDKNHSKNIIVVMEQDYLKHLSCKDFNKRKFNCKETTF